MIRTRHLDIQTKIILVLVAVMVPTFLFVTILQNKLALPIFEGEMRSLGLNLAESLASHVVANRWHTRVGGAQAIENEIQEQLYQQPSILRIEVYLKDPSGVLKQVASNVLEDFPLTPPLVEKPLVEKRREDGFNFWDIVVPIRQTPANSKTPGKVIGVTHVQISMKTVSRLLETFWKITGSAALVSVVILMLFLTYFLRRAVINERLLRVAENQNLQLSEQLHETQRQMMNIEKFAVMGQLTANFAHEIGTPLNAISGHLQLLKEELTSDRSKQRLEILNGEVDRITSIVKGFLQTTSKPVSQSQLVDVNALVDKTMGIVRPRVDSMGLEVRCSLDRKMGPVRVVPLDVEQILLNLLNNSLDSLRAKGEKDKRVLRLQVETQTRRLDGREWAEVVVYDTGLGIKKSDLRNVMKPFFTTKQPGEGTGLGLTICQQIASKYGGMLHIESKEGAWAKVKLQLPYGNEIEAT